ncbi:MAG: DUF2339 domain-containing protein [Ignavibacteriae bacterium HGW-Ignavibacteriae-4]|jgi:uncharacterized membrane protein|nr:MAG: DUF2339 domain-containing protein [Ignavibacteriae bacterium HGW-Ignavibacteriae-4]
MNENQEQIDLLLRRIEQLSDKQSYFKQEVESIRAELYNLRYSNKNKVHEEKKVQNIPPSFNVPPTYKEEEQVPLGYKPQSIPYPAKNTVEREKPQTEPKPTNRSMEKFIGENLINKIGIIILVIGVGIGAKYAIDNQLISPLTRIILGYLVGLGLLGTAYKLKEKFTDLSAVLLSGSMAVMYFITFFAYSLYSLMPQLVAFLLMFVFTFFTVLSSLHFKREIISIIGLVGAYFVPFLLSNNSGQVEIMYSYMLIINLGVLYIAYKQYWKYLKVSSFVITWLIYSSWFLASYKDDKFMIAFIFLAAFFLIFHISTVLSSFNKKSDKGPLDLVLTLINSLIFYLIGSALIYDKFETNEALSIFTIINAVIYFATILFIRNKELSDRNLFYIFLGLVLSFLTIVVPIQFEGNWITIFWAGEAVMLFWIGQNKGLKFYNRAGALLIILATISITLDWGHFSNFGRGYSESQVSFLFNIYFLTSILYAVSLALIVYITSGKAKEGTAKNGIMNLSLYNILPILLVFTLYYIFYLEIQVFWEQLFHTSKIVVTQEGRDYTETIYNWNYEYLKTAWLFIYSLVFVTGLILVNKLKLKNQYLSKATIIIGLSVCCIFLIGGLYNISLLRDNYLLNQYDEYFSIGFMNIALRYISLAAFGILAYFTTLESRVFSTVSNYTIYKDVIIHTIIVWLLSSELIHWLDIYSSAASYKLGLSILWGLYSLMLIILGIWKYKKHIRLAGFSLFSITLLKLFFYDITSLDTISKTIIFVIIGLLMLFASYLYNRYKGKIDG